MQVTCHFFFSPLPPPPPPFFSLAGTSLRTFLHLDVKEEKENSLVFDKTGSLPPLLNRPFAQGFLAPPYRVSLESYHRHGEARQSWKVA